MPAPPNQAARPIENIVMTPLPSLFVICVRNLTSPDEMFQNQLPVFSCKKFPIQRVKNRIPRTVEKDNCQPASNKAVGLMSRRIIAANESVFRRFECRRKKTDTQKTKHIIAARCIGALGGTVSKKIPIEIIQIVARAGFIKPAAWHNRQIIQTKMPTCSPERLIKCSRPVLRNAL